VRKIRIDFGIPIEFPSPFPILARPESESKEGAYFAVGDIHYEAVDEPPPGRSPKSLTGKLIYIKPAIYNAEPRDIYNYAKGDPTFPHETTADQFFDEPQFESHRMLGFHILERLWQECAQSNSACAEGDLRSFVNWLDSKAEGAKPDADGEREQALKFFQSMLSSVAGAVAVGEKQNGGSAPEAEAAEQTPPRKT
jgi:hypothetical protein